MRLLFGHNLLDLLGDPLTLLISSMLFSHFEFLSKYVSVPVQVEGITIGQKFFTKIPKIPLVVTLLVHVQLEYVMFTTPICVSTSAESKKDVEDHALQ